MSSNTPTEECAQDDGINSCNSSIVSGIFIKSVCENSPAKNSGKIFMGDRVISVSFFDFLIKFKVDWFFSKFLNSKLIDLNLICKSIQFIIIFCFLISVFMIRHF